jgi:hypothetical protein
MTLAVPMQKKRQIAVLYSIYEARIGPRQTTFPTKRPGLAYGARLSIEMTRIKSKENDRKNGCFAQAGSNRLITRINFYEKGLTHTPSPRIMRATWLHSSVG